MSRWWHKDNEVIRQWYEGQKKWHPLTGELPFRFSSGDPQCLDMQLLEIIIRGRVMWSGDAESLKRAKELYQEVPQLLPSVLTDHLPGPKFKPLSLCAIYLAWDGLKRLYSGKMKKDTELWRVHENANRYFQEAFLDYRFTQISRIRKKSSSRGGSQDKKDPGFIFAVEFAWGRARRKTCLSMWECLRGACAGDSFSGGDFDLVFEKKENKLYCYHSDGTSRGIGFRAFQKYVSDHKKKSQ